jgi:hypothetical protein
VVLWLPLMDVREHFVFGFQRGGGGGISGLDGRIHKTR